jgi:hypothetical protein
MQNQILKLGMVIAVVACVVFVEPVLAGSGSVTFDFGTTVRYGTPYVFGACKFPMKAQAADFYPKLKDAGVTFLRADFYFEVIIPAEKCASVEDYRNNVNGIQDSGKWDYQHLYWIDDSRKYGFKTFISATYTPTWLSYSGTHKGVPKDWAVWEDIVRKVYARYKGRVDWVETWNEVEYWGDLSGSPYTSKEDYLADNFYHTVRAIRLAGGTIPTGGFAFAWEHDDMLQRVLVRLEEKYGKAWTEANFNFYSVHRYGSDSGNVDLRNIRLAFENAGLNPNKGIFVDEWNYTTDWARRSGELYNAKAIGYTGKTLANFIKSGVNAAYFSLYPSEAVLSDTIYEDGGITMLSFYRTNGSLGTPLPQSYPFKLLSNRLGLGKGIYAVKAVRDQTVIDACCAVNCEGQRVAFIANYYDSPNTVKMTFKGLTGTRVKITDFYANTWDPACNAYRTITNPVSGGTAEQVIEMVANTCVGLILEPDPAEALIQPERQKMSR